MEGGAARTIDDAAVGERAGLLQLLALKHQAKLIRDGLDAVLAAERLAELPHAGRGRALEGERGSRHGTRENLHLRSGSERKQRHGQARRLANRGEGRDGRRELWARAVAMPFAPRVVPSRTERHVVYIVAPSLFLPREARHAASLQAVL